MDKSQIQNQTNWVPLSYCVRLVQMDLDDFTTTQYEKMLQYAILGYQDLNLSSDTTIEVFYGQMDEKNLLQLPSDFVDYYKIGMVIAGKVWNLGLNNNIALPREQECGDDVRDVLDAENPSSPSYGYLYTDHFQDGSFVGGLYGFGGGFRESHYRVDKKRRQIVFDSEVPRKELVVEYKSNGISAQTMVPRQAVATIVAYIHWARLRGRNRINERRELEREWKEEKSQLRAYNFRFVPSEYLDMLHQETMQAPKR